MNNHPKNYKDLKEEHYPQELEDRISTSTIVILAIMITLCFFIFAGMALVEVYVLL